MKRFVSSLVIVAALIASPGIAAAQTYPARPVTMIVPYPPGGPTETLGRIFAERFRQSLGQPVIMENIGGAAGTIGTTRAVRAAPDGYTINFSNVASHVFAPIVYRNLKFDVLKDLDPIALLTTSPFWLVAGSGVPARNLPELVAWLKANPDKGTFGIVGPGSPAHLCGVHFKNLTGTNITFVPYRGAGPTIQDLVGGQISLSCLEATATRPTIASGKIRAFALLAPKRWAPMPDVPTADEGGVKGLYLPFWHGLWVPKGTPAPIQARLNAVAREALADPAMRKRLTGLGVELPPPEQQTPQALHTFHAAEIERWRPIIEAAHINPE